ncbi:MAG: cytochrome c biogenesis protein CcsA [Alphaproteobacteria bacterium]|nr:cytochrome c biogenesis protein CcsA [Alphaproteobacteria bacterium]
MILSELGNFFLAMALGFASAQFLSSFWGVFKENRKYLVLGQVSTFLQNGFLNAALITLMIAFYVCDFSILTVVLHDHTQLPWYYRLAATWGNHEGSLLLFVLILSGIGVAFAALVQDPLVRARALTIQGLLTFLFLVFLIITSNPFASLPFTLPEGSSLNPLLQDRGLLLHPPLLYLGYVGFSAPFSLAVAALWGEMEGPLWRVTVYPWVLFAWGSLTAGITLGSWWAYYELGWGGWWFWDPVENASLMPWLAGTALLHILRTNAFYRWSLFLSLLTFGLSLLGTFLVRSGLISSVHLFAQDPERGFFILVLLGGIMSLGFLMWIWKAPHFQSSPLPLISRQGILLFNSLLLCGGLVTVLLGTLYPLWSESIWGETVAIGAPYFDRTLIPLMLPLLLLMPIGVLLNGKKESLFPLLVAPLVVTLGGTLLFLYVLYPVSLWSLVGSIVAIWILGGSLQSYMKRNVSIGALLAHVGVGITLLGVSIGGGFRTDETYILSPQDSFEVGGEKLTFKEIQYGNTPTYQYEKAILTYPGGEVTPEKRLYQPQNSLLSETAILTNGFKDLYVILGPYQGDNQWLIRASFIPLAPWIWIGGLFMVGGVAFSWVKRKQFIVLFLLLPFSAFAEENLEKRANALNQEVRCPVCLGQSIAESEAPESKALKGFIVEQFRQGKSEENIRDHLRALFGEEILFRPSFQGKMLFLWLAPFGIFLLILLGFLWKAYRSRLK